MINQVHQVPVGLLAAEPQLAIDRWRRVVAIALDDIAAGPTAAWAPTFVERNPEGLPNGDARAVLDAFAELVDEGVLAVLGPANSDNCTALAPAADAAEVPVVGLGATMRFPAAWCFSVPWGSCPEDALLVESWVRRRGFRRAAVVTDELVHAAEYVEHFARAAARDGVEVVALERLPATVRDAAVAAHDQVDAARSAVERCRAARADVLVHLGPLSLAAVAGALDELGWDVPRIANNAFAAAQRPGAAARFEGWVGTSCWHDGNELLASVLERHRERYGEPAGADFAAVVYDAVRVLAEAASLAPAPTRAGMRAGLEAVRGLPSAMGAPGNALSFGPWDHRALKSPTMMVLRRIDGGRSVLEV